MFVFLLLFEIPIQCINAEKFSRTSQAVFRSNRNLISEVSHCQTRLHRQISPLYFLPLCRNGHALRKDQPRRNANTRGFLALSASHQRAHGPRSLAQVAVDLQRKRTRKHQDTVRSTPPDTPERLFVDTAVSDAVSCDSRVGSRRFGGAV